MDQLLFAGSRRFRLASGPEGAGVADEAPLRFASPADALRLFTELLGDPLAMMRLRSVLAENALGLELCRMDDQEVLLEAARWLTSRRLFLWREPTWLRPSGPVARGGGAQAPTPPAAPDPAPRAARAPSAARDGVPGSWARASNAAHGAGALAFDAPLTPASPPGPPSTPPVPLSWYEVVILDEVEAPIAGVAVELSTPAGRQRLETDGGGRVRVDQVPPGQGSIRVVGGEPLARALAGRASQPRRTTPLPEADDLAVLTPARLAREVGFPDARTQRVMLVTRTDVVCGSTTRPAGTLHLLSDDDGPWRFAEGLISTLNLCSTGAGARGLVGERPLDPVPPPAPAPVPSPLPNPFWLPPDTYLVQPGDTLSGIAARYLGDGNRWPEIWELNRARYPGRSPNLILVGDRFRMPAAAVPPWIAPDANSWPAAEPPAARAPWLDVDVDALHEALFDEAFATIEAALAGTFAAPLEPSAPAWPPPTAEAVQFANHMVRLTLQGHVDNPIPPTEPV